MADNTLLITPDDCFAVPNAPNQLLADLRSHGLIGDPGLAGRFPVGDAYPRLLSFMGCSPYFKTEPDNADDSDYCHLSVDGPWPAPRLLGRLDSAWPRCPACRKPDRDWNRASVSDRGPLPDADALWCCPHCSHRQTWGKLDWRQRAGYARFALVFHHIYEGEVVPGPELLAILGRHVGGDWRWFYG